MGENIHRKSLSVNWKNHQEFPHYFYLSALYSINRHRAAVGVCSDVTGGRSLPQPRLGLCPADALRVVL
jgi:hypothetical protein